MHVLRPGKVELIYMPFRIARSCIKSTGIVLLGYIIIYSIIIEYFFNCLSDQLIFSLT